jgi:ABC-2 type transport system ATP-binding protein
MHNIVKRYKIKKNKEGFAALDGMSLSVREGEVFGLLGSNGAGKTTFIKVMSGLLRADGGTGSTLGYDIYRVHKIIRAAVSLVAPTADVGTDNNLTVRQNLEFWAVVYDLARDKRAGRIDEMLDFLDLRQYENHWPMSISAGNRQKLAIARSLLVKNPIVFLDEPTVKLDAKSAANLRALVSKINREFGITVIMTTHYIFEAEELCERVAIMHRGKIISCDTVENLRRHLKRYDEAAISCAGVSDEILVKIKSIPPVALCEYNEGLLTVRMENMHVNLIDILKALRARNVSIIEVATNEPTLEDIFIDTIGGGGER